MKYLAVASASVPGLLPRLSSPSAEKLCIVLGQEAREGPNTQDQARRLMAETGTRQCGNFEPYFNQMWFTVFLVLMMIVHGPYFKVNSRARSQRRVFAVEDSCVVL